MKAGALGRSRVSAHPGSGECARERLVCWCSKPRTAARRADRSVGSWDQKSGFVRRMSTSPWVANCPFALLPFRPGISSHPHANPPHRSDIAPHSAGPFEACRNGCVPNRAVYPSAPPRHASFLLLTTSGPLVGGMAYGAWRSFAARDAAVDRCARGLHAAPDVQALCGRQPLHRGDRSRARTLVKLGDVPKTLRDAFVLTEDKRFYSHAGIDGSGSSAPTSQHSRRGFSQGSRPHDAACAQRVSRWISRARRRSFASSRKPRSREPLRRATRRTDPRALSQPDLPRQRCIRHRDCAQRYFGKSARISVSLKPPRCRAAEGAGQLQPRQYPERAVQRRNTVIELMRRNNALTEPMQVSPVRSRCSSPRGRSQERSHRTCRVGAPAARRAGSGRQLYEQGLKVYTTLDLIAWCGERSLEKQLREIGQGSSRAFRHRPTNLSRAKASGQDNNAESPYLQGASLPSTAHRCSARPGRRENFDDSKSSSHPGAAAGGSTFKPFVYADAIRNGVPRRTSSTIPLACPVRRHHVDAAELDLKFEGQMSCEGPVSLPKPRDDPSRHGAW